MPRVHDLGKDSGHGWPGNSKTRVRSDLLTVVFGGPRGTCHSSPRATFDRVSQMPPGA